MIDADYYMGFQIKGSRRRRNWKFQISAAAS